ncbi:hypothetical protein PAXRUDRAFT_139684, partial [Paxillus rubicundulus Ve08.2h10]
EKTQSKRQKTGQEYLNEKLLTVVGESFTLGKMATMLLHISQIEKTPLTAAEAIRAIAFIIEEAEESRTLTEISNKVMETMSEKVASQVITALAPHVANMLQALDLLGTRINEIDQLQTTLSSNWNTQLAEASLQRTEEAADAILSSLEDIKNIVALLTPSLDSTQ